MREVEGTICFRADFDLLFWKAYLLWGYRFLRGLVQLLNRLLVISKIFLTSYKDDWETLAEMQHFGYPLYEQSYQYSILFTSRTV